MNRKDQFYLGVSLGIAFIAGTGFGARTTVEVVQRQAIVAPKDGARRLIVANSVVSDERVLFHTGGRQETIIINSGNGREQVAEQIASEISFKCGNPVIRRVADNGIIEIGYQDNGDGNDPWCFDKIHGINYSSEK